MKRHERFQTLSRSEFPHEEETLDYLFSNLPDRAPYRAWSNFTFIDHQQEQWEVDLFLVTPLGVFLTELKSTRCDMTFTPGSWIEHRGGFERSKTTPLKLTNEKAKRFSSLLRDSKAFNGQHAPYVTPLVIFTPTDPTSKLRIASGPIRNLLFHDECVGDNPDLHGAVSVLSEGVVASNVLKQARHPINKETAKRVASAFDEFMKPHRRRILDSRPDGHLGQYELGEPLAETPQYRDYLAVSRATSTSGLIAQVRARIYHPGFDAESRADARRARDREYDILRDLNHQNILPEKGIFDDSARGPVLFLQHPEVVTLEEWIKGRLQRDGETRLAPSFERRARVFLHLLDGLEHAHSNRVFHRAIRPDAVLINDSDEERPEPYLYNWMTARGEYLDSAAMTSHVSRWVDERDEVYLPLPDENTPKNPELQDIFSLGLLGVYLFTGRPPAQSIAGRLEKLKSDGGIRVSDLSDSVSATLDQVLFKATHRNPEERYSSILALRNAFQQEVLEGESEATSTGVERVITDLRAGQSIGDSSDDARFLIIETLGKGSTARAYRIRDHHSDTPSINRVLKVALREKHNARLDAEAEVLERLSGVEGIVELHGKMTIDGHRVLVLEDANQTLRERIREGGKPSIRDIEAVGRELFDILDRLENRLLLHRDIKPENIGYFSEKSGDVQLKLFDFSLADIPETELEIGTEPYRDKMLKRSGGDVRRKWESHAERWSAAVSLYEFITQGHRPQWKNNIDPTTVNHAILEFPTHALPSANRDALMAFFRQAFQMDTAERFESAQDMARHWARVFEETTSNVTVSESKLVEAITNSPDNRAVSQLPLDDELVGALEQAGVRLLKDLRGDAFSAFASSSKALKKRVAPPVYQQFLGLLSAVDRVEAERTSSTSTSARDYSFTSMTKLADNLWGGSVSSAEEREWARRELIPEVELEYGELSPAVFEPYGGQGHDIEGISREEILKLPKFQQSMAEAWERKKMLRPFREDMAALVARSGGLRTFRSVVQAMRAKRGDNQIDEVAVMRHAIGVCRAAFAAETVFADKARFQAVQVRNGSFLYDTSVVSEEQIPLVRQWLTSLGATVDELVEPGVPVSRQRSLGRLRAVEQVGDISREVAEEMDEQSLLELAVEASSQGALSTRSELYPRGMAPLQVVKHASFVFYGSPRDSMDASSLAELRKRAMNQFKMASRLPEHEALVTLLDDAGVGIHRSPDSTTSSLRYSVASTATSVGSSTVTGSTHALSSVYGQSYDDTDRRFTRRREEGGALVIHAKSVAIGELAPKLAARYDLQLVDMEDVVFDSLREIRDKRSGSTDPDVVWNTFLVNGDPAKSPNFEKLLHRCVPLVERRLDDLPANALLFRTGVAHSFGFTELIESRLRQLGSVSDTQTLWVLEPASRSGSAKSGVGLRTIVPYQDVSRSWARSV